MIQVVNGIVMDARVKVDICPKLDHGPLTDIHAIVMHQTGGSTAAGTLSKYKNVQDSDRTGAHFLLDKNGTMYQTLAVNRRCAHVAPILSRCIAEKTCTKEDVAAYARIAKETHHTSGGIFNRAVGNYEAKKAYPVRYPYNPDAIGIEVVGRVLDPNTPKERYEGPTPEQDSYLHWFVRDLMLALKLTPADIYRHPQLSAKTPSEASSLTW